MTPSDFNDNEDTDSGDEPLPPPGDSKESPPGPHGAVEGGKTGVNSIPFWGKILIASIFVFLAAIGYFRSLHQHAENKQDIQDSPSDVPDSAKRKLVPDLLFSGAVAGDNKHLSDFKGKVVLVSFWASWCAPCLIELPSFIELHQKLGDKGLVIVPVNVDEDPNAGTFIKDFWKTKKFPFPTFFDPSHKGTEFFQVDALPSNFVLDKKGRLVAQGYGANDWADEKSVKFIEQLLQE
jgi:thiol-disulfide isomerase/thioredoxin